MSEFARVRQRNCDKSLHVPGARPQLILATPCGVGPSPTLSRRKVKFRPEKGRAQVPQPELGLDPAWCDTQGEGVSLWVCFSR